jgi:hypothetical protein
MDLRLYGEGRAFGNAVKVDAIMTGQERVMAMRKPASSFLRVEAIDTDYCWYFRTSSETYCEVNRYCC